MSIEQNPPSVPAKRSAVEVIKENSRQLRGTLAEELAQGHRPLQRSGQAPDQVPRQLPAGRPRRPQGPQREGRPARHYMFMVRCKIPGGKVTAEQYLAVDDLAEQYANGTLRITTRQGIQFHGVLKTNLKATIAGINQMPADDAGGLRRRRAQRDGRRRPARATPVYAELQRLRRLHRRALRAARDGAYHEIWLNGKKPDRSDGRRDAATRRRADLRQGLPAAQVQDRLRAARRQLDRRLRPGPRLRWPSSRTARSSATTSWSAAAWA